MRAVVMREFGPPRVLEPAEAAEVQPGPGQVVVDVELANVTFVETQVRAGKPPHPAMLPPLPAILGNGVGGTVAEVGAGVDRGLTGRRVVTSLNGTGGYAERAVAAARQAIEVPEGVELREAVALLADGRTALALMARARPKAGDSVGSLLVQLARNAGARVVALAGGERKLRVARDLGADVAVDYSDTAWPRLVRDAVGDVDVVFDGVGGDIGLGAFGLLGPGGRFCPFGMASGGFAPVTSDLTREHRVTVLQGSTLTAGELTALVHAALAEAAAGRIRPVIGQELELARAADAHAAIEARAPIGKTLLTVHR